MIALRSLRGLNGILLSFFGLTSGGAAAFCLGRYLLCAFAGSTITRLYRLRRISWPLLSYSRMSGSTDFLFFKSFLEDSVLSEWVNVFLFLLSRELQSPFFFFFFEWWSEDNIVIFKYNELQAPFLIRALVRPGFPAPFSSSRLQELCSLCLRRFI
ncbi:hypothetical protein L873DRAFT_1194004 [Choiromyces venosus 120613-1]|uniref:Uncharacterized protein n=1 Tax=Choiromyces venosus 120613-1 TaxID=1336337 RepID=A0A3N4JK19_9PEZI|nr:hypothetical protein L873DRAFT_1194004 [Choiromyces venosus 120613-1]